MPDIVGDPLMLGVSYGLNELLEMVTGERAGEDDTDQMDGPSVASETNRR